MCILKSKKKYIMLEVSEEIINLLEKLAEITNANVNDVAKEVFSLTEPVLRKIVEEKTVDFKRLREELHRTMLDSLNIRALEEDVLEKVNGKGMYVLEEVDLDIDDNSIFIMFREFPESQLKLGDMWIKLNLASASMGFTFFLEKYVKRKPSKKPSHKLKYSVSTREHLNRLLVTITFRVKNVKYLPKLSEISDVVKEIKNDLQGHI